MNDHQPKSPPASLTRPKRRSSTCVNCSRAAGRSSSFTLASAIGCASPRTTNSFSPSEGGLLDGVHSDAHVSFPHSLQAPRGRSALRSLWQSGVSASPPARSGEPQPIDSSRIVSIGGAVTETIYALGLEGRIVGVDTTSLYPPEALKRAPNVGYMRALSAEGILSLKPSWVIAIDGSGPPAALKLVSDAGVPLTMIHDDPSPDGVAAKIETIGKLLGAEEKAAALANETRARFALVEQMRPADAKAAARAVHPVAAEWPADGRGSRNGGGRDHPARRRGQRRGRDRRLQADDR